MLAAPRDASWYNRPDTRRVKVRHVDRGDMVAACSRALLVEELAVPARDVPGDVRCRRPGCRERWPGAASENDP